MCREYTILRNLKKKKKSPCGGDDSVTPSYVREGMKMEQKLLSWNSTQNVLFEIQKKRTFEKCIIYIVSIYMYICTSMCILTRSLKGPRSIKFHRFPFWDCRGKVKKKHLSQSETRASSLLTNWSEKHKHGSKCWGLASCQVYSNSVQHVHRSRKCLRRQDTVLQIYTRHQWKRNTCISDSIPTWACASKCCFHQTTLLYICYQKIILCIDWL